MSNLGHASYLAQTLAGRALLADPLISDEPYEIVNAEPVLASPDTTTHKAMQARTTGMAALRDIAKLNLGDDTKSSAIMRRIARNALTQMGCTIPPLDHANGQKLDSPTTPEEGR